MRINMRKFLGNLLKKVIEKKSLDLVEDKQTKFCDKTVIYIETSQENRDTSKTLRSQLRTAINAVEDK